MGRLDRALATLAPAAVVLLSAAACLRRIWATDFWWQFAAGRYVAEHGWPRIDVFSYTAAGHPWIEMRWLYCLAQFETMRHLGPTVLVVGQWLVVACAFALVAAPFARRAGAVATSAVVAVALLASTERLLVRPELVGWILAGAYLCLLERHRRGERGFLYLLPLLQILWVNSHPSFVFGPLFIGLAAVVSPAARRPLAFALGGSLVASLVNPYGLRGLLVPFAQFAQIQSSAYKEVIAEYASPFAFGLDHTAVAHYVLLIALCLGSAAANLRRLDPFWLVLALGQLWLSAIAVRNAPLFALAAVPFVLSNLERSQVVARLPRLPAAVARRSVAILVVVGCAWYARELVTDRFSVRQDDSKQAGLGIAKHRYPVAVVDFLERSGLDGRVYATLLESSYLTSRGRPVFADPRGDVYEDALFRRYVTIQKDPAAWQAAVREFDIRIALAALDSPFIDVLRQGGGWSLVYFDTVAALFVREDVPGNVRRIGTGAEFDRVLMEARRDLPPPTAWSEAGPFERVASPKPYLDLSGLCLRYGRLDAAEILLDEAARTWPRPRRLAHRRAAIAEARGDWSALWTHAKSALEETPDDPQVLFATGEAAFQLGRPADAVEPLARAAELRPEDSRIRELLARARGHTGRTGP